MGEDMTVTTEGYALWLCGCEQAVDIDAEKSSADLARELWLDADAPGFEDEGGDD